MGMFSKSATDITDETGDSKEEINVQCGEILDISKVAEFHQNLKTAIGKGGKIVLDAAAIERIDAAALQLLTVFLRDATARKVQAQLRTPSDALIKAASLLGLNQELGLPGSNLG